MSFRSGRGPAPPPPKGEQVAQYGLTEKDSLFNGRADVVIYELVEYQARGFIVEESFDWKRKVWVYKVFAPKSEGNDDD